MTLRAIKKTVVLVALVALAGVPFFGTIVAAPSTQEERQGMFGEVVTNDAGVLTLTPNPPKDSGRGWVRE